LLKSSKLIEEGGYAMAHTGELQQVVEHLRSATDRVAEMRRLVLESGGAWPDHEHDVLFEVCFLSIAGLGFGAKSAVKNWIVNAEQQFAIDKVA
jgi:hypothetical protein|tara:strand:+ start:3146 stop:3427 length:282 start_codon:yes stop_codon:yes gene_type:complete